MSKPPLVSVIVPTRNSSEYLEACLRSIKAQSYPSIEILVVDNNSSDQTKQIAGQYTDRVFNHGPERSAQRNYGADKSKGEFLLIIDSDMELSKNVVTACVAEAGESGVKGIIIPEESFGIGFWAQCKKLERSFYVGVNWMEAARFFSRTVFKEMHGYDEQNTGTEDYDLPQRISAKYGPSAIGRINEFIYHNEQKISLTKTCRKKFYYAQRLDQYKSMPANVANFSKQSNPLQRYKLFFSNPGKLLRNPSLGLGMLVMKTSEFGFGAAGYLLRRASHD